MSIGYGCESVRQLHFTEHFIMHFVFQIGIVAHEIGHALGLWHEQSRKDRDSHIDILINNILPYQRSQFDARDSDYLGVGYDIGSVMQYGPMVIFHALLFERELHCRRSPTSGACARSKPMIACTETHSDNALRSHSMT